MDEYKTAYTHLFNRVSDIVELLQIAQQESEHLFMEGDLDENEDNKSTSEA